MEKIIQDREKLLSSLCELKEKELSSFPKIEQIYSLIKEDKEQHFLSLSQEDYDKISYARCKDHIYDNNKRVKTSFEKYVRRQLELSVDDLSDYNLNYMGRRLRIKLIPQEILQKDINILSGDEVTSFYKLHTEIDSCMTGSSAYKTELYSMNPDHVSLVTYKNKSRALLWTVDESKKILDRIYPNNCEDSTMLKLWAEREGFITRCNNYQCSKQYIPLSDEKTYSFILKHDNTFPYMDTFCYGTIDGNKVKLFNHSFDDCLMFQSTGGGYSGEDVCYNCRNRININNSQCYGDDYYCDDCFDEEFFTCHSCQDVYHNDESLLGSDEYYYCEDCFNNKFVYCESCGEPERKSNAIEVDGDYYCEDCANEKFFLCSDCEEYFPIDDILYKDDECYCQDCYDNKFHTCYGCGDDFDKDKLTEKDNEVYCVDCLPVTPEVEE